LYSVEELAAWKQRIDEIARLATHTFVVANNDAGGKSVVNALQMAALLGDGRRDAPSELIRRYPQALAEFQADYPVQRDLFADTERAVA
jgi:uncharacterized protein YecE (DUF72 family)